MQVTVGHEHVLQGRTFLLFCLFCLSEDDVLLTDAVYRVLLCIGRHAETLVRRLIIVALSCRHRQLLLLLPLLLTRLLFLNCKYTIVLITNISTQQ